jgi:uncharacterized protein YfaS (alpha-2-macroglobulin family)
MNWKRNLYVLLAFICLISCGVQEPEGLTPPQLVYVSPQPEEELPLDGTIIVYFDQPMDQSSIEITVEPALDFTLSWQDDKTLEIKPDNLERAEQYVVTVNGASSNGAALENPASFSFNTIGALRVSEVIPAATATYVEVDSTISVFFNRPVVPLALLDQADELPEPLTFEPDIPGEGKWLNTSIYLWQPSAPLTGGQTYAVEVAELTAQDGAAMEEAYTWEFTTIPPAILDIDPAADSTDLRPEDTIIVWFNQPMDTASVEAAFELRHTSPGDETGEVVPGSFIWTDNNDEFTFVPDDLLELESTYTAQINADARGASSLDSIVAREWDFETIDYPRVIATLPLDGEQGVNPLLFAVRIAFSAEVDPDSVQNNMVIEPEPPGDISSYLHYSDKEMLLTAILDDNTEYTVTLLPGIADPYGNTIDEPYTFSFTTGAYPPQFLLEPESWLSILDIRHSPDLLAFVRNVDHMDYQLYKLPESELLNLPNQWEFGSYYTRRRYLFREWSVDTSKVEDNTGYNWRIPMGASDTESAEPGVYLFRASASEIENDTRRVVILANANVITKHSLSEALAWVTDMYTGEPLPNVDVTFYDDEGALLGSAISDDDGMAAITFDSSHDFLGHILVVAQGEGVYGVTHSAWGTETYQGVSYEAVPYVIYPYTDRPIYRPGHEVFFKAIVRERDDVVYSLPEPVEVSVWVKNPQYETVYQETYTTTDSGSIDGSFMLDAEAATGRYAIHVSIKYGDDQETEEYVWFQVAEYERPEFQAALTPDRAEVIDGVPVNVTLDASYFFGGPVQQGWVTWKVFAQTYYFRPDLTGRRYYSFVDYARNVPISADNIPGYGHQIADGDGAISPDGQFEFTIPTSLTEFPGSQQFSIEATLSDGSGQFVTAQTTVVVHKGSAYAGIRPERYLNAVDERADVNLISVGRDGQVLANQPLEVEVIYLKRYSVQEVTSDGRTHWVTTTDEITIVSDTVVTGDDGTLVYSFTPVEGGAYKIIVTASDQAERSNRSSAYIWATGGRNYIPWGSQNSYYLDLVLDKANYEPGDTAQIMIPVPFTGENIRALVTVERSNVMMHEIIEIDSNSYVYELPITEDYAPNIFFTVTLIKGADALTPQPDFRYGTIQLDVNAEAYELDVSLSTDVPDASPGDAVTYRVETTDRDGNPVDAEVSLALVDKATLSLSPPNTISLFEHFYRRIQLGVWSSLSLVNLEEPIAEDLFDQAKGGGGGYGDSFYDLRRDFRDTAYWNATLQTGPDGVAEVTITLPDNLTTWNMDARAITAEGLVGQSTHELVSTERLLIRPITPRFFIAEDEVSLGALAYNNTQGLLDAVITLEGTGYTLDAPDSFEVTIPAGGVVRAEWPVTIMQDAEWVDLTFSVDAGELRDSTKPPIGDPEHDQMLPVYNYVVAETVGTAGQLAEAGTRTETIFLPPQLNAEDGIVEVNLDHSLAGAMTEGLSWLENYPYQCTEQTVSRFLANAYTLQTLKKNGLVDPALESRLEAEVGQGLQRLYNQQHADGGWGWFVSGKSSTLVTAYVVQGMVAAREAGYLVDETSLNLAIDYLQGSLNNANIGRGRDRQAYVLYVLALAGEPDPGRTSNLFNNRLLLQTWSKALLTQTMWMINPDNPRLSDMQSDLINDAVLSATGTHWVENETDTWNWNTDTRTTAIVLDTFALIWPENDLVPNTVRWLMTVREHDRWQTTQETTWALIALGDWMAATGELSPTYDWGLALNGESQLSGSASPEQALESETFTVLLEDLASDHNTLSISRGEGEGRLYYDTQMTAYLPVDQIEPLSNGFFVSRRYLNAYGVPVQQGNVGEILTVELTIIVPEEQNFVVIEDPLPAGAEGINWSLLTESGTNRPTFDVEGRTNWWGWWWFTHIDIRDEKAVLYAERLPAGSYVFGYDIRLGVPGSYHAIPAVVQSFYFPEVFGRAEGMLFEVLP